MKTNAKKKPIAKTKLPAEATGRKYLSRSSFVVLVVNYDDRVTTVGAERIVAGEEYIRHITDVVGQALARFASRERFIAYHQGAIAQATIGSHESTRENIVREHMAAVHKTVFGMMS